MWIQWRLDEEHLNWTWSNVTIYWKALGCLIVALFWAKKIRKLGSYCIMLQPPKYTVQWQGLSSSNEVGAHKKVIMPGQEHHQPARNPPPPLHTPLHISQHTHSSTHPKIHDSAQNFFLGWTFQAGRFVQCKPVSLAMSWMLSIIGWPKGIVAVGFIITLSWSGSNCETLFYKSRLYGWISISPGSSPVFHGSPSHPFSF